MYKINDRLNFENTNHNELIVYSSLNKAIKYNNTKEIIDKNDILEIINVSSEVKNPLIYIYNTHDYEEYKNVFISDYSIVPNVKIASFILKDYLNDLNIYSYVEENSIEDYLKDINKNYYYSYNASRHFMEEANKKYDFKIYIDIHRDSIKYKDSIYTKDNTKYAKVLFVLAKKNSNYKYNEEFIKELNNIINRDYNGLSRGILNKTNEIFNQDISNHSILLEVGGIDNSMEEINNTMKVIAEVLKEYIDNEMGD